MVLSYSLKYLSRCYSEDILYMWLKSIISWHQVKEIILDNLGEPGPLSCKASRTELNFPKGKEIPLWATASACGESSCAESSSLPFLTIAHLMVLHFSSSPSVQFSCSVVSNSLQPHRLQLARLPCPSPPPDACSNSCPPSQWCHPNISSSVIPSPPAFNLSQHQGLFQWVSSSCELVYPHIV